MKRGAIAASLAVVAAAAILVAAPEQGSAASGCVVTEHAGFGSLFVEGDVSAGNTCGEALGVVCAAGSLGVSHAFPVTDPTTVDIPDNEGISGYQPVACDQVNQITLLGGAGDDVIDLSGVTTADGFTAGPKTELDGGDGSDSIVGSEFADRILQGSDGGAGTLSGGAGNDRLIGDSGVDLLNGGPGRDVLLGLEGGDVARGGTGDDRIDSGPGIDAARGEGGNDLISLGTGNDTANGGPGRDTIFGGYGRDVLHGDAGPDSVFGDDGADRLFGESGNDTLRGGPGHDILHGGTGRNDVRQ